jgi:hypothetical protein
LRINAAPLPLTSMAKKDAAEIEPPARFSIVVLVSLKA